MLSPSINKASMLGPSAVKWWQDWSGQPCAIIASGKSLQKSDVALLKGRMKVAAIKENYNLCPWADVVYGCDVHWWRYRRGLPDYTGLKLAYDPAASFCNINLIKIPDKTKDELLYDDPGVVGSGGNSGFQLLNIVTQFGASRVLLLGFDMQGEHWYGRNNWDYANNPDRANFRRWTRAFDGNADKLKLMGVDVINTSRNSAITKFKKMAVQEAVEQWGL